MLRKSKKKSSVFGLSAIVLVASLLTGCMTDSSARKELPSIYQPSVLRLPANKPVETLEGLYTPQESEVWHSDARFRKLEQQVIDLSAALAQSKK